LKVSSLDGIIKPKAGEKGLEEFSKSGAFAGALDPDSPEANLHSVRYYAGIRKRKDDIAAIARNTGWTERAIAQIKEHIFFSLHDLGGPEPERFDPDYHMAVSWPRLIQGREIRPQDIVLLKHEYLELTLMKRKGLSYRAAHDLANEKHNYAQAIQEAIP